MPTLIDRRFETDAPRDVVWDHLADVPSWPSWARHITAVRLEPPGPLTPTTVGTFRLHHLVPTRFAMTDLERPSHWTWRGAFLWLTIDYDHELADTAAGGTSVRFVVRATGPASASLGRLFARIYSRNLDRAIPLLQAELARLAA